MILSIHSMITTIIKQSNRVSKLLTITTQMSMSSTTTRNRLSTTLVKVLRKLNIKLTNLTITKKM